MRGRVPQRTDQVGGAAGVGVGVHLGAEGDDDRQRSGAAGQAGGQGGREPRRGTGGGRSLAAPAAVSSHRPSAAADRGQQERGHGGERGERPPVTGGIAMAWGRVDMERPPGREGANAPPTLPPGGFTPPNRR